MRLPFILLLCMRTCPDLVYQEELMDYVTEISWLPTSDEEQVVGIL